AMSDDTHRIRKAVPWVRAVQLVVVIAPAYEMRDEIGKPRKRDGRKDHTSRPHPQTVRGSSNSPSDRERCVARNECDTCCEASETEATRKCSKGRAGRKFDTRPAYAAFKTPHRSGHLRKKRIV